MYKRFSQTITRLHELRDRASVSSVIISMMIILYDNINKGRTTCTSFMKREFDRLHASVQNGRGRDGFARMLSLVKNRRAGVDFDSMGALLKVRRSRDMFHVDYIDKLLETHSELEQMLAVDIYLKLKRADK